MHPFSTGQKENSFSVTQLSVNQAHRELTVKISVRSDPPNLKVNIVFFYEIGKQPFYLSDLAFLFRIATDNCSEQISPFLV